jgi:predicted dehydrogenase
MDLVAIGSPSGLHAEQGIAACRRGLHVLVEKTIDVTVERADALIQSADAAGVRLGVFFQDHVQPDLVRLHDALQSGRLGRPLLASARVKWFRPPEYYEQSRWRGTWALDGGGALMNQGNPHRRPVVVAARPVRSRLGQGRHGAPSHRGRRHCGRAPRI